MLLPLSCLCSLQFAIHAHSLVIRVNLLLYLQTHQLMRCLLCLCSLLFASLSCLCSLLFAASYLRVSRAPSLVPLQSPVCSLLFASLSCSLSRAFAASYLRVYRILDAGRRLELLHKTQVDGGPVSFWMTEQMVPSGAMNWKWASQQWRPSEMLHKSWDHSGCWLIATLVAWIGAWIGSAHGSLKGLVVRGLLKEAYCERSLVPCGVKWVWRWHDFCAVWVISKVN